MACAALGVRFVAVLPEGVSNERLLIIRRYGGEWALVPAEGGMPGAIAETERMAAADPDVFLPRQFTNPDNAEAHELRTGPELVEAVSAAGARLDGFVASVGTAGTLMGVGRVVRVAAPGAVVARVLVADEALDAEQGGPACLGIPGVVDCLSGLLDEAELGGHPPLAVPRVEAMDATRELARRGFPVGPSSGLNLAGARLLARELGPGHHVATVLCDRMERYFSTDLFDDLR
jgi:cysteine synthase A